MSESTLSAFDRAVDQIMAVTGVDRARAIQVAKLNFPTMLVPTGVNQKAADILEKKEQQEIYKLFRGYRFNVRNLSQARASKQAPGLGDAWIVHRDRPIAFWWESKRQVGGHLSDAQHEMRSDCWRCGIPYHYGDRYDAAKLLVTLGVAREGEGQYGIVPIDPPRTSSSGQ